MIDVNVAESRLRTLAGGIRAARKSHPYEKRFSEDIRREAVLLLDQGLSRTQIADACGICFKTVVNWRARFNLPSKSPCVRELTILPEQEKNTVVTSIENATTCCEIDFGSSVRVRFPLKDLTPDMLRSMRKVFGPC